MFAIKTFHWKVLENQPIIRKSIDYREFKKKSIFNISSITTTEKILAIKISDYFQVQMDIIHTIPTDIQIAKNKIMVVASRVV